MATEAQQRARAVWSAGDFDAIAAAHLGGRRRPRRRGSGSSEGDRVLDVALRDRQRGDPGGASPAATSPGSTSPRSCSRTRGAMRADAGVEIEWVEGDAQEMPFEERSFDVVVSTFGCMFAPDHGAAAGEIARVLAPGGRIGRRRVEPGGQHRRLLRRRSPSTRRRRRRASSRRRSGACRDHVDGDLRRHRRRAAVRGRRRRTGASTRNEEAVDEYETKFGPIVMLRAALEPEGRWGAAHDAWSTTSAKSTRPPTTATSSRPSTD